VKILITAGPTREFFDTVRFISNPSSGRMGFALAEAAVRRGHEVVLVAGPVALVRPRGVEYVSVVSAAEMSAACKRVWASCDAAIMTAAVCDYRPSMKLGHKLAKRHAVRPIKLEPTEDIATALGTKKGGRVLIGFAMEDHNHHAHAEGKLRRKRCDAIVLNGPENVGGDRAVVEILVAGREWTAPLRGTKRQVASRIVKLCEELAAAPDPPGGGRARRHR
jgi:phosphopantothenoylcysteine decarboxylase/phosphopantothenate--cysteine ligase